MLERPLHRLVGRIDPGVQEASVQKRAYTFRLHSDDFGQAPVVMLLRLEVADAAIDGLANLLAVTSPHTPYTTPNSPATSTPMQVNAS